LHLNEIKSVIKMGELNKAGQVLKFGKLFRKVAKEVFAVKHFTTVAKI
jgi:hypothetical protein